MVDWDDDFFSSLDFAASDDDDDNASTDDEVLAAARKYGSGNAVAQQVYGNGALRVGSGRLDLDWASCVERMRAAPMAEKADYARAIGTFAQVAMHGDALRVAGAVEAATDLLSADSEEVLIAAAEVSPHAA